MTLILGRVLPIIAVTLGLNGCNLVEHQSAPAVTSRASVALPPGVDVAAAYQPAPRADIAAKNEVQTTALKRNFNLNVYGISYHPDREGARRSQVDNEFNKGLGLGYEFHNNDQGVAFLEAGFYEDSRRNWAKFAGPAYQFKFGDRWRLGGALMVIQSQTYNNGRTFVAPIPLLTYDLGIVKLNALYAPRFRQKSDFSVFGFYVSIPFSF